MYPKNQNKEKQHLSKEIIHIDENFVSKLRSGDECAFELLFDKYQKDVFRYAHSLIKSKEHAQEIAQDVFMKVWLKRETLKPELSFRSFLFTITKNMSYDFLVKASKDLKLKQYVFKHNATSHSPVENYMLTTEYELLKRQAINRLPAKRKRIFEMSRNEGKSYQDISTELGIKKQTVKNQMSRALSTISIFLESNGIITVLLTQIALIF